MNENSTVSKLIQDGDDFTAWDLYDNSDWMPVHRLHELISHCVFLGWHEDSDLVRVQDVTNDKTFWSAPEDVTILAAGWLVAEMARAS